MNRAAVWGANGFVGRHLSDRLLRSGWTVRALTREGSPEPQSSGTVVRLGFDSQADAYALALQNIDVAFHCAGTPNASAEGLDAYVAATRTFAETTFQAGARLILLSTVAVYGAGGAVTIRRTDSLLGNSNYARSRRAAELACEKAFETDPTRLLIVRVPMVVGADMRSNILRRFCSVLTSGIFPHPGPRVALLNCIGVNRLSMRLAAEATTGNGLRLWSDNIPWVRLAEEFSRISHKRMLRIPLPSFVINPLIDWLSPSRALDYKVFSNLMQFADDGVANGGDLREPATLEDIGELMTQSLSIRQM